MINNKRPRWVAFLITGIVFLSACGTFKDPYVDNRPIENPFWGNPEQGRNQHILLRSKTASRSLEIEIPEGKSSFELPLDDGRSPAAIDGIIDERYRDKKPSYTDRQITKSFPQASGNQLQKKRAIENELGVVPEEGDLSYDDSYLASMDFIKQLFKQNRHEAALIETDKVISRHPTNPKAYQMRGTVLDRLGYQDLAIQAWEQALKLEPNNESLKRYLSKKKKITNLQQGQR